MIPMYTSTITYHHFHHPRREAPKPRSPPAFRTSQASGAPLQGLEALQQLAGNWVAQEIIPHDLRQKLTTLDPTLDPYGIQGGHG